MKKLNLNLLLIIFWLSTGVVYALEVYSPANLQGPARKKIESIQRRPTITKMIKDYPLSGSAYCLEYLLDRLHVFASIASKIIPDFKGHRAAVEAQGGYSITDSRKLRGRVEVISTSSSRKVFFGEGSYNLFWNITFTGSGFAVIDFREESIDGSSHAVATLSFYGKIDNLPIRALIRIVNFFLPGLIDNKINLSLHAMESVIEEISANPKRVYNILVNEENISLEERQEFKRRFIERGV